MRKSFTRLFSMFVLLLGLSLQMAYGIVFDGTKSVPVDASPNAKPTDFATKFVVAFDVVPVISDAGGTLVIYKGASLPGATLYKTLPITKTSTSVVVVGKTLEVTHGLASFAAGDVYTIAITDGAITGLAAGALLQGVYDFTIGDFVAPKLLTAAAAFTPNKGAVSVMANLNGAAFSVVIPFDEAVNKPATPGNKAVYIYKEDGTVVDIVKVSTLTGANGLGTATVTVPVATTAIFAENTKYYVSVDAGAFVDASVNANAFAGLIDKTVWTFTTRDYSAPTLTASVSDITNSTAKLNVSLTEKGKYYYILQTAATADPANAAAVQAGGTAVNVTTINTVVSTTLAVAGSTAYEVFVVAENAETPANLVTTFTKLLFSSVDNINPTLLTNGILNNTDKKTYALYMVFSEQVAGGAGMLDVRNNATEAYVKSIAASAIPSRKITAAEVTANTFGAGRAITEWVSVVDLEMTLPSNTTYYVVYPAGYIKDLAGNSLTPTPINKGDWSFTSSDFELPTVAVAFTTPASLSSIITITFNETVSKQLSTTTNWAEVVALEQGNTPVAFTAAPAGAASTTVIALTPTAALSPNTVYTVKLRPDAVKDASNNAIRTENAYTLTTGDLAPFSVQYGSSAGVTTTTGLVAASTFKIKFNKAVKVNTTGTTWVDATGANLTPFITVNKTAAPGAGAKLFTVAYDAATFTATITPTDALLSFAPDYVVALDGTKVRDSQSALLNTATGYVATQTYTVKDYNAPVAVNSNDGNATLALPTITFTDDNLASLTDLAGVNLTLLGAALNDHITFKEGSSNGPNLGFTTAYAAGVITITPTVALATGKTYYYGIGASVKDAAGNVTAGKFTTFTMTAATVAPTIVAETYTVNASAQTPVATKLVNVVPVTNNVTVTVTFNDNVKEFTGNPVSLTDGTTTWNVTITNANVSGKVLTVVFPTGAAIASEALCTLTLPAALVQGSVYIAGTTTFAQFAGKTITFDSKDIVLPVVTANTPAAAAVGVALNTALKVDLSEKVTLGTGNILVKDGATVVETIPVNSTNVVLNGAGTQATITKANLPKYSTVYTVTIPAGAFLDEVALNGNALTTVSFTTDTNPAPVVTAFVPADNSDLVALSPLTLGITFSEEVVKAEVTGSRKLWYLFKEVGATRASFDGLNDILPGSDTEVARNYIETSSVGISGKEVSIVTGYTPVAGERYYVLITPGSFYDKSLPTSAAFAGVVSATTWNFTTKDENAGTVSFTYTKRADNLVATTSNITINFTRPIVKADGSAINDVDIANLFTLTKTVGTGLGTKAFVGTISSDKKTVTILNSSLVTLGELMPLSTYTIGMNAAAIKYSNSSAVAGAFDTFSTSDYTIPVVTPSIAAPIADVKKDEATVTFSCTDNINLAAVYYTIQEGTSTTAAPTAAVVKADKMKAVTTAAASTTYKFTGLTEKTSYVVWAVAVDAAGNESAVNSVVFVTDDVTKPTLVTKPTSFDAAGKLSFIFNENVSAAASSVRVLEKTTMKVLATLNLLVDPAIPLNPKRLITNAWTPATTNTLVEYYIEIEKGLVADVPVVAGDAVNTFDGLFRTDLMVTSKDVTVPTYVSSTPALGAVSPGTAGVDLNLSIQLTFSEAVQKIATVPANAFIIEKEIGVATYEPFEVVDPANVVTNGTSTVTVTLSRMLSSTTTYRITFNKAIFEDLSGNAHAAGTEIGFVTTKDVVAPTVVFAPAKAATAIAVGLTPMTLTFNEAIRLLDNSAIDAYDLDSLVYFKKGTTAMAFDATIDGTNKIITIVPAAALVADASYTYGFKAKFEDASGNVTAADMATFSTVVTPSTSQYVSWTPAKASPYVAPWPWLGNASPVSINFTGPIFTYDAVVAANSNLPVTAAYLATAITVTKNTVAMAAADLVFTVVDNKTVSVAPKSGTNWGSGSIIEVTLNANKVQINEGNVTPILAEVSKYQAQDVVAPKVDATYALFAAPGAAGYYPANVGLAGVSPVIAKTDKLKLYFDENVQVGTGTVEIHRWDGVLAKPAMVATVDATDKKLVTLGDLTGLPTNQEYYAIVNPGIVKDVTDNNNYAGLTAVKVWKFMLKDDATPQVLSYMPNTSNIAVTTDLMIHFDRPVLTNGGYVALYKSAVGGDAVQIWRTADNGTTGAFTISGNTATVNINDLDVNTRYYVEASEGTFISSVNTNKQAAISRADWTFSTEVNTAPTILATGYSPAKDAVQMDVNSDLVMTFDMPVQAGTGNIQLHAADGSNILNFDVKGTDVVFANDVVTVNLPTLLENKSYYVIIPATAIRNVTLTPEYFAGITVPYTWKFTSTTDLVAPTVVVDSYSPVGTIPTYNGVTFKIKFNEKVQAGAGAITIKNTTSGAIGATKNVVFGTDGTVTFDAVDALTFASYQVIIPANGIVDFNNNYYVPTALSWTFSIMDTTLPTVASLSPADGTIGLPTVNDLKITFSEEVYLSDAAAKIKVYKQGLTDNSLAFSTVITAANLSADKKTVSVTTTALMDRSSYVVLVDQDLVKDEIGNKFAGILDPTTWNFQIADYTGPVVTSITSTSLTNAKNTFDVAIEFDEDVLLVAENVTVTNGTVTVKGSGKSYVATVKADDGAVVVLTVGTEVKDATLAGNKLAAAVSKTITVGDNTAPTLEVTAPAAPVKTVFTVGLKFSEPVSGVLGGVTVENGKYEIESLVGGKEYILTVTAKEQTLVTIVLSDAIKDISASTNKFAGQTLTYTTGDFTSPQLVTWTPFDETVANNHPTFKMTFNENVVLGTGGNLVIYKVATTTPVLTIPLTAAMINGKDVTVSYVYNATTGGLDKDTRYYVTVGATALKDNAGNAFAGVTNVADWTFKTGSVFATNKVDLNGSLFKVYPNPFDGFVNVDNASELSKVIVTNIAGQTVKEVIKPSGTIQLNELRSGVYFISLYNMDNVIAKTAKIVKM